MIRLMEGIVVVMVRRTIGSRVPARARRWIYAILVASVAGGILWLCRLWYLHAEASTAVDRPILALSAVLGMFVIGGLSVLLAEAARDKSGRVEAVLSTLPLSRRAIAGIAWTPTVALACACVVVSLPPAGCVLVGLGYPVGEAFALVASSLAIGLFVGVGALCGSYLLLRSSRWNAARYPIAMVVWISAAAALVAESFLLLAQPGSFASVVQLLPLVAADAATGTAVTAPLGFACAACALAAGAAFVLVIARSTDQGHGRTVWLTWGGGSPFVRPVADLLYVVRDATSLANIVGAFLANVTLVVIAWHLPGLLRPQAVPAIEVVIAVFVASPLRGLRGVFPARLPPQQLIGLPVTSWVTSQAIVTIAVATFVAAPGLALIALPGVAPLSALAGLAESSALALVVAALCGWTVPVSGDNALGQIVMTVVCSVLLVSALTFVVPVLAALVVPVRLGIVLGLVVATFLLARAVEGRRWGVPMIEGKVGL